MTFKRPSCLQSRRNGGGSKNDDWSAFPVRQLFVLGMFNGWNSLCSCTGFSRIDCFKPSAVFASQLRSCRFSRTSIKWSRPFT